MELIAQKEKSMRPTSESPPYAVSPVKGLRDGDETVVPPQIPQPPEDCQTSEGQTMRFHCRATGNPAPKVEWYLNGQQIRKSKRFTLWNDGLHYLEINPARAYDTGSLVAVAVNKAGQAQVSCTVDVEPLGDLRSNLKRVDGSSPDASLRAMRMDRKVQQEKNTEILGEYERRRGIKSQNSSRRSSRDEKNEALLQAVISAQQELTNFSNNHRRISDSSFSSVSDFTSFSETGSTAISGNISGKTSPEMTNIMEKVDKKLNKLSKKSAALAFCGKNPVDPREYEKNLRNVKDLLRPSRQSQSEIGRFKISKPKLKEAKIAQRACTPSTPDLRGDYNTSTRTHLSRISQF